jgi:hypothetical protein
VLGSCSVTFKEAHMLVKHQPVKTAEQTHREYVQAMWALFLVQNAAAKPSADGSYYLGEISDAKNDAQRWLRNTPYSICGGIR